MDFLANQDGSVPVVTPARHLDFVLGRFGVTREHAAMPETVLLAITPHDLRVARRLLDLGRAERFPVGGAGVYLSEAHGARFAVVGPAIGAPVAAIVLEALFVLGARRVVAIGLCGSLQESLRVGAIVVPRRALREEGTSYHYLPPEIVPEADPALAAALAMASEGHDLPAAEGIVWTTDAIYREARAKVAAFGSRGVLAVDMETSAIFAVADHLGLASAVILVVSDELAGAEWLMGFQEPAFAAAHEKACRAAIEVCATSGN